MSKVIRIELKVKLTMFKVGFIFYMVTPFCIRAKVYNVFMSKMILLTAFESK